MMTRERNRAMAGSDNNEVVIVVAVNLAGIRRSSNGRVTYINKQVLPQAPSPTMTSLRRISAMMLMGSSSVDGSWGMRMSVDAETDGCLYYSSQKRCRWKKNERISRGNGFDVVVAVVEATCGKRLGKVWIQEERQPSTHLLITVAEGNACWEGKKRMGNGNGPGFVVAADRSGPFWPKVRAI